MMVVVLEEGEKRECVQFPALSLFFDLAGSLVPHTRNWSFFGGKSTAKSNFLNQISHLYYYCHSITVLSNDADPNSPSCGCKCISLYNKNS